MTEIIEKRNKKSDQFNCRSQNLSTETKELPASSLISDEASSGIEITKIEMGNPVSKSTDTFPLLKKKRKTKSIKEEKRYSCNICERSYFSYPALYTHKRNKHNIIPITGKQDIFKNKKEAAGLNSTTNLVPKYRYSEVESMDNLFTTLTSIKAVYAEAFDAIYLCKNSMLFREGSALKDHEGFKMLLKYESSVKENLSSFRVVESCLPCISLRKDNRGGPNIDDVLISYMINFFKVIGQLRDINVLVVKFVILLREYLNVAGWDYKKTFIKYEVSMPIAINGSYTQCNDCEDIPDLINDYVSVFIPLDQNMFNLSMKEFLDIIQNFCNWLFVNNLTNFKISENDWETGDFPK